MTFLRRSGRPMPDHMLRAAETVRARPTLQSRREFLASASAFGATAATAWAMLGLPAPARAQGTPTRGGTVRIQAELRPLKDPRTFDFNTLANFTRGWLEYLVQYNSDGTFEPMLLEGWEVSDDATTYTLNVRRGVTWNDGTPFTSADVAWNIARWCEKDFEGNAMASRFTVMIDPQSNRIMDGVMTTPDAHTVVLSLPSPDITLIASMADYLAAIVPQGFDADTMLQSPVGTGPYLPEAYEVGTRGVLVRNEAHAWWGGGAGGPWMDRIEYLDYGSEPAAHLSAAEADEIDVNYSSEGDVIQLYDLLDGWTRHEVATGATIVTRCRQSAEVDGATPYADARVRRALAMAVDNAVVLELGYSGYGTVAENTHVGPMHPEHAELPPPVHDPAGALALLEEAGMADFEHDLISLDASFWKDTSDAVAGQLRAAGIKVKRTVIPGSSFWNNWDTYPFSTTNWNHRPLGVQNLALAYRSGIPWNETDFRNERFDALLDQALSTPDVDARRELMAQMQTIMQEEGVIIQPYWRNLYNHSKSNLRNAGIHIAMEIRVTDLYWDA